MSKALGELGERVVQKFFEDRGWRCCDHNVFFREGELDLVFRRNQQLKFVEVKTRKSSAWDADYPRMSFQKIKRYKVSLVRYLRSHPCRSFEMIVAYVTLDVQGKHATLKLLDLKSFY